MKLAVSLLFASAAFAQVPAGQSLTRVFPFQNNETPAAAQEMANVIRTIGEIQQVSMDKAPASLAVTGTTGQIALAAWLFTEIDKLAGWQAPAQPNPAADEYPMPGDRPGSSNEAVRVFYLAHTGTPQRLQEIVNTLRTIPEITRIIQRTTLNAVVVRGTSGQIALAAWLVNALDKAAAPTSAQPGQSAAAYDYREPDARDNNAVRVLYVAHTDTPQGMQEIVNALRTIPEITRVIQCSGPRALVLRGTAAQAALAEWLFSELDRPPAGQSPAQSSVQSGQNPAAYDYQGATRGDGAVRVFHLANTGTAQGIQEILNAVRTTTQINRAIACSGPMALALRGTAGQIALAEQLIKERDKI